MSRDAIEAMVGASPQRCCALCGRNPALPRPVVYLIDRGGEFLHGEKRGLCQRCHFIAVLGSGPDKLGPFDVVDEMVVTLREKQKAIINDARSNRRGVLIEGEYKPIYLGRYPRGDEGRTQT